MTKLIVRNTFLEIQDDASDAGYSFRRSQSAGSLSTSTNAPHSSSTPSRDEPQPWRTPPSSKCPSRFTSTDGENSQPPSNCPSRFTSNEASASGFNSTDGEYSQEDEGIIHYTQEMLPSIGSRLHSEGSCKPCHYVMARAGCAKGNNCEFCHFPHKKSSFATRPCKDQRQRFQKLIDSLDGQSDPVEAARAASRLAEKHPFLKKKLKERLEDASLGRKQSETNQDDRGKGGGRLCKVQRERYKKIVAQLDQQDPTEALQQASNLAEKHPYLRKKLQHWLAADDSPDTQSNLAEYYDSPQIPASSAAQSRTWVGDYGYKISL